MTDAERVLSLLIHDLRTPLGVAHGYLRLIRADRLGSPEERDRALAGTQDALGRISRLCADAGAFLGEPPDPAAGRAQAADLADRVAAALDAKGIPVEGTAEPAGMVAVGPSVDRVADAVATLLATRAQKPLGAAGRIEVAGRELRFVCGPAGDGTNLEAEVGGSGQAFDPWQAAPSLPVVLAHRVLTGLGGRIWTVDGGRRIAMAVPMEIGTE